jgi:hypothetical protein
MEYPRSIPAMVGGAVAVSVKLAEPWWHATIAAAPVLALEIGCPGSIFSILNKDQFSPYFDPLSRNDIPRFIASAASAQRKRPTKRVEISKKDGQG